MNQTRGQEENGTRPSPPPPLEANDQVVIGVVTAGWIIALIVLLIVRDSLPSGTSWWIWTCATGTGMGLFALWYVPRLKRARDARAAGRGGAAGLSGVAGAAAGGDGQSAPRDSGSNTVSSTETPGRSTRS